ncbi:MAG TPA: tryptophan--tRNA ligase [Terracidiphilus sp.]|jgi:tryptophanyl-tRNA synthetase|nr:tryptophan--tRNA ligase [Terracidiphilus sp.]
MSEQPIPNSRPRVLSGMRPTGKLHLGNYMGALANWVKLQDDYECYFFIADVHALTTDYADTSNIAPNTREVILDYLAAGLDPAKSVLFVQSDVKQHYELPLLLGMITPVGWLERVPSYKEMQENLSHKDLTTYGFLGYPVLMASDILLYQPKYVPVGQDQQAHVELTREVARRFNFFYPRGGRGARDAGKHPDVRPVTVARWEGDEVLPEPDVLLTPSPKLPGTDGRKMSKSYGNTILLSDPEPEVRKKLKTMVTDPARVRRTDPGDPDKCPVGDLHKVFSTPETLAKVYDGCRSAGIGCIECKSWAADALVQLLNPIQDRRAHFSDAQVDSILKEGSERAAKRAEQTMVEVRAAMQMPR